jgi:hypothetical protein
MPTAAAAPADTKQNRIKAGELVIDSPTLINLGFEWLIQGDDNRNAKVEVSYRRQPVETGSPPVATARRTDLPNPGCVRCSLAQHVCRKHSRELPVKMRE